MPSRKKRLSSINRTRVFAVIVGSRRGQRQPIRWILGSVPRGGNPRKGDVRHAPSAASTWTSIQSRRIIGVHSASIQEEPHGSQVVEGQPAERAEREGVVGVQVEAGQAARERDVVGG